MKNSIKLIILSLFLFLCEEKNKIEDFKSHGVVDTCTADRITRNARMELTNGERVTAILEAGVVKEYTKQIIMAEEGLTIHFLGKAKDTLSVLTADRGKLYPLTRNMEARGDVVVERYDGLKLLTEKLQWDDRGELIFSKSKVKIVKGRDCLMGKGFKTPADLSSFEIDSVFANTFRDIDFIRPGKKK